MNIKMIERWFAKWSFPWTTWVYINLITYGLISLVLIPIDAFFRAIHTYFRDLDREVTWAKFATSPGGRYYARTGR